MIMFLTSFPDAIKHVIPTIKFSLRGSDLPDIICDVLEALGHNKPKGVDKPKIQSLRQ